MTVLVAALVVLAGWLAGPVPVRPVRVRLLWSGRVPGRRARLRAAASHLQGCCEGMAADLRAGLPAGAALARAAADWPALQPAARAAALGGDIPAALRECAGVPGHGDLVLVAASWQVSQRSGTALAASLSRVGSRLRRLQASRRIVASELASARATARLMVGLPAFGLLLGSSLGGDPVHFLLTSPWGWACLAVGLGLDALGLWWIDRIAQSIVRSR